MHITENTTREKLVEAAFSCVELTAFLGGAQAIAAMETADLREKITEWIIEGDEAGTTTEEAL